MNKPGVDSKHLARGKEKKETKGQKASKDRLCPRTRDPVLRGVYAHAGAGRTGG